MSLQNSRAASALSSVPFEADPCEISCAGPGDIGHVRRLFQTYAAGLPFSLDYQSFDEELATLPGLYAPPTGAIVLARHRGQPVGCVGLVPSAPETCEMKRVFLEQAYRARGIGRRMIRHALDVARGMGYRRIRLDTYWRAMPAANAIYRSEGFIDVPRYSDDLGGNVQWLGREL